MFNSVNLGNFCSQSRKDRTSDFGERASCGSNLYLPSCTYYVPEFSAVSSFLPQAPSRQITYPYSSNLSQVQPVRDVSYGLDPSSKWHHRGNYASCYSGEELVHRDCLPPSSTMTEMLMKNESVYSHHHHHPSSNYPSAGFYSGVGKNNVLPQGFDRFFESTLNGTESSLTENCVQKGDSRKLDSSPQPGAALLSTANTEKSPEDEEENSNSGSCASSSGTKDDCANKTSHSSRNENREARTIQRKLRLAHAVKTRKGEKADVDPCMELRYEGDWLPRQHATAFIR
ncbi:hypothetical protein DPEC_G00213510 [Dallia pectoralis]|uniref:Uncharacterized protein n=1 Tax=Dallia pectoralis TaxID=75939 RepID=A0ACC2G6I3_DALPE|nr:hypothetical protein DPEC_G00213510 [Dallia pectoralis]